MGARRIVVLLVIVLSVSAGCITRPVPGITVTNLDTGDIPSVNIGDFDVYTDSFQILNPTNSSYENVEVEITLVPAAVYCHGVTKTFSYPLLTPREKKIEQLSIAEFANLGCQYNYTYRVSGDAAS